MTKRKGLSAFISHSLPAILDADPDCGLLVVGENPNQGLTKMGEGAEVSQLISARQLGTRCVFLGQLPDDELISCYAHADVQVFPIIDVPGDVEGFGMVAIEAAACGTPTVAFSVGGVTDAISDLNGEVVEPGRYDLFTDAIIRTLQSSTPRESGCLEHAQKYRWEVYNEKIQHLIAKLA